MAHNVIMPKSGMAMEEGTIVRWLKAVGDHVSRGEAIAVIETDKVTMDLESDFDGTLLSVLYGDGTVVKATETIAWIGARGEEISQAMSARPAPGPQAAPAPTAAPAKAAPAAEPAPARAPGGRVPATPAARARAAQAGLDLSTVTGTGPGGAVRLRDLAAAPARPAAAAAPVSAPAATLMLRADVTLLSSLRDRLSGAGREPPPWADYAYKAAAAALRESPLGPIRPEALSVIDLEPYGVLAFTPPIAGPGTAALGLGAVEEQLRRDAGGIQSRRVLTLCLACDPAAAPVTDAAAFLGRVRALMEDPLLLLAVG